MLRRGNMKIANWVALIILAIVGINLLIDGIFVYNFVGVILGAGTIWITIFDVLAGLSAIWLVFSAVYNKSISFTNAD